MLLAVAGEVSEKSLVEEAVEGYYGRVLGFFVFPVENVSASETLAMHPIS